MPACLPAPSAAAVPLGYVLLSWEPSDSTALVGGQPGRHPSWRFASQHALKSLPAPVPA